MAVLHHDPLHLHAGGADRNLNTDHGVGGVPVQIKGTEKNPEPRRFFPFAAGDPQPVAQRHQPGRQAGDFADGAADAVHQGFGQKRTGDTDLGGLRGGRPGRSPVGLTSGRGQSPQAR